MSNKLTDEQIAELAPDRCEFYCYKNGEIIFHNLLGFNACNSKGERLSDDYLDSGEWKSAKEIPRRKPTISKHTFSDSTIEYDSKDDGKLYLETSEFISCFRKDDVIALAKHFNLTAEDLK